MFKYVIKRIFIFIPTILAVSLITFSLNLISKGDPVESMLNQGGGGDSQLSDKLAGEEAYMEQRKALNLDLPMFYFSMASKAEPDTLYKVPKKGHRETLSSLINMYGNWEQISTYYKSIKVLEDQAYKIVPDSTNANTIIKIKQNTKSLYNFAEDDRIQAYLNNVNEAALSNESTQSSIMPYVKTVQDNYEAIKSQATKYKNYIPSFNWYGVLNQYHIWMFGDLFLPEAEKVGRGKGFFRMDFGKSYKDKRPIATLIGEKIGWTMLFSFLSILISYLIAIPIGVKAAVKKDQLYDKTTSTVLFVLYSLPSFWIATLMVVYLGGKLAWFPVYGLGELSEDAGFMEIIRVRGYHMIMPLFCWTYGSLAFISRQMRGGMLNVLNQDFIRTARAKGLPQNKIVWKHAFRNSLLPIITIFANVFPLMIGGSVVLEVIFSIPGLGKYGFDAIIFKDYPVVLTVMMFSAILTMIGYLVSDILYAVVDPRISYSKK